MNEQKHIFNAVRERGYIKTTDNAQICRQLLKLIEELAEVTEFVDHDGSNTFQILAQLGFEARHEFDSDEHWQSLVIMDGNEPELANELADVMVVLCCIGGLLNVDLMQMALEKATKDIERGVR